MTHEPHRTYPKDAQTQRTRWELRAIFVIAIVILVGSLAWRALGHHPATPEPILTSNGQIATPTPNVAAGPAGVQPHPSTP
jgi:hypothetical protein